MLVVVAGLVSPFKVGGCGASSDADGRGASLLSCWLDEVNDAVDTVGAGDGRTPLFSAGGVVAMFCAGAVRAFRVAASSSCSAWPVGGTKMLHGVRRLAWRPARRRR